MLHRARRRRPVVTASCPASRGPDAGADAGHAPSTSCSCRRSCRRTTWSATLVLGFARHARARDRQRGRRGAPRWAASSPRPSAPLPVLETEQRPSRAARARPLQGRADHHHQPRAQDPAHHHHRPRRAPRTAPRARSVEAITRNAGRLNRLVAEPSRLLARCRPGAAVVARRHRRAARGRHRPRRPPRRQAGVGPLRATGASRSASAATPRTCAGVTTWSATRSSTRPRTGPSPSRWLPRRQVRVDVTDSGLGISRPTRSTCSRRSTAPATPRRCPSRARASDLPSPGASWSRTAGPDRVLRVGRQGRAVTFTLALPRPQTPAPTDPGPADRGASRSTTRSTRSSPTVPWVIHTTASAPAAGRAPRRPRRARSRCRGGPSARRAPAPAGRPAATGPWPAGRVRRRTPGVPVAEAGVRAVGQRVHPRPQPGPAEGPCDLGVGGLRPGEPDVLDERGGEDVRVVVDQPDPPRVRRPARARAGRVPPSRTAPADRVDEPHQQRRRGCSCRTRTARTPTRSPGRRSRCRAPAPASRSVPARAPVAPRRRGRRAAGRGAAGSLTAGAVTASRSQALAGRTVRAATGRPRRPGRRRHSPRASGSSTSRARTGGGDRAGRPRAATATTPSPAAGRRGPCPPATARAERRTAAEAGRSPRPAARARSLGLPLRSSRGPWATSSTTGRRARRGARRRRLRARRRGGRARTRAPPTAATASTTAPAGGVRGGRRPGRRPRRRAQP